MTTLKTLKTLTPEQADLVVEHLGLAKHLAGKRAAKSTVEYDDLLSDAYLGLIAAARSFDPTVGAPFATHAYQRIRGAIADGIRDRGALTRSDFSTGSEIVGARARFLLREQRHPTTAELLAEAGWTAAQYAEHQWRTSMAYPLSLNLPHGKHRDPDDKDFGTLEDLIRDEQPTPHEAVDRDYPRLREAVKRLPEREQVLVGLRYWQDCTQAEIASVLGLTPSRITQLQAQALDRLRLLVGTAEAA